MEIIIKKLRRKTHSNSRYSRKQKKKLLRNLPRDFDFTEVGLPENPTKEELLSMDDYYFEYLDPDVMLAPIGDPFRTYKGGETYNKDNLFDNSFEGGDLEEFYYEKIINIIESHRDEGKKYVQIISCRFQSPGVLAAAIDRLIDATGCELRDNSEGYFINIGKN